MRLVYLGTPASAVAPLRALVDAGHEVALVVTRSDKRRGRGVGLSPSPVKAAALELGLTVSSDVDDVLGVQAELGVVVAFGQLIKPHVLAVVPMVNLHFSLLPRWRGAAPVERAILAGDEATGVCVMAVEEGLDTGGVFAVERVQIEPGESSDSLRERLVAVGTRLLVETLASGLGDAEPQQGVASYAAKLTPDDLALDWARPATELARLPSVGKAWTTFRGRRLLVVSARVAPAADAATPPPADAAVALAGTLDGAVVATGHGGLELVVVQPEGRAAMAAQDWLNGARPRPGERLGG